MMPPKTRKILLIGAGGWGAVHLEVYTRHRQWTVSAIADARPEVLRRAAREYRIPSQCCFQDPLEALDRSEYDAISVVVRNPFRVPILLKALETGKPVFTEKPLVHSVKDANRVCRAARESSSVLMVSQNYRFEPQTRRMAEFVQRKRLWGRLNTVQIDFSRNVRDLGDHYVTRLPGGLGLGAEMCIHHYDLLRFLLGANPVRIRASGRRAPGSAMKGWGTIEAWIEFPDAVFVNYHATYDVPVNRTPWGGSWTLDFDQGSLTWHPYAENKIPIRYHTPWSHRWPLEVALKNPSHYYASYLVGTAFEEFTRALEEDRAPECTLRDNLQSLAIVFAINHAARTGATVAFPAFLKTVLRGCPLS